MTYQQRQAFLQARATARLSALTSSLSPGNLDDVTAITTDTNVPIQIVQVSQGGWPQRSCGASTWEMNTLAIFTPFTGRATSYDYIQDDYQKAKLDYDSKKYC
jgi:hypothetical protein